MNFVFANLIYFLSFNFVLHFLLQKHITVLICIPRCKYLEICVFSVGERRESVFTRILKVIINNSQDGVKEGKIPRGLSYDDNDEQSTMKVISLSLFLLHSQSVSHSVSQSIFQSFSRICGVTSVDIGHRH